MFQNIAQFKKRQDEDLHVHIANYLEICDTFKINGVSDDVIRFILFPFSFEGRVKQWLASLPRNSIITWDQIVKMFLLKYFSLAKTTKLRNKFSF